MAAKKSSKKKSSVDQLRKLIEEVCGLDIHVNLDVVRWSINNVADGDLRSTGLGHDHAVVLGNAFLDLAKLLKETRRYTRDEVIKEILALRSGPRGGDALDECAAISTIEGLYKSDDSDDECASPRTWSHEEVERLKADCVCLR